MEKANMHSLDMVNENIKKIGNLFPECVTETVDENGNVKAAIDFEKLQENLSHATIGEGEERYQFTWPGKREAIHNANAPTNMTLRPCKEESVDFDKTENLYIEGDNLEVLKLLQENYLGKVKMIYIDPPYNTGNDFVYNDDFKEDTESFQSKSGMYDEDGNMLLQNFEKNTESNGRFHTDWLNMMYPRLKIARNLLSDDGVIFISIDDNEVENLRKVCDEIYGESNFISQLGWQKVYSPKNQAHFFSNDYEFVLCYAKHADSFNLNTLPRTAEMNARYKNLDNDPKGPWKPGDCVGNGERANGHYEVTGPTGKKFDVPQGKHWVYAPETMNKLLSENAIYFGKDGTAFPAVKQYLSEVSGRKASSLLLYEDYGHTDMAKKDVIKLFPEFEKVPFDTPKPVKLVKMLTILGTNQNDLVLDFFSGSATTAQSIMELNAGSKESHRKYILVQIPEFVEDNEDCKKKQLDSICDVGKERIRRAGKKIKEESGEKAKDLDIGFRVLKLADSNMKDVYYSPAETDSADIFDVNNVKEDRTPLDLLFQVMPECNLPLSSKIEERTIEGKTVYFVNGNYLVACFDEGITEKLIKSVIDVPDSEKPYYFYMRNLGLESDKVLDNFEQLFVHYSPSTKRKVI